MTHCEGSSESGHMTACGTLQCVVCGAEFIGETITPDHDRASADESEQR